MIISGAERGATTRNQADRKGSAAGRCAIAIFILVIVLEFVELFRFGASCH